MTPGYVASMIRHFAVEQQAANRMVHWQLVAEQDALAAYLDHCAALARSSCIILGVPRIKRVAL